MDNRRASRYRLKVIHRHRASGQTERRISELIFVNGQPRIILGWLNVGGIRAPVYLTDLDAALLRRLRVKDIYYYAGVTSDPQDTTPLPAGAGLQRDLER